MRSGETERCIYSERRRRWRPLANRVGISRQSMTNEASASILPIDRACRLLRLLYQIWYELNSSFYCTDLYLKYSKILDLRRSATLQAPDRRTEGYIVNTPRTVQRRAIINYINSSR